MTHAPGGLAQQPHPERLDVEYVLPLKWASDTGIGELTLYLARLARWMDVTVIDASPAELYGRHHRLWHGLVRHRPPEPWPGRNGKVAGVVTGIRAARHSSVIIADDDVRWDLAAIRRAVGLLDRSDLVRPQNYFCSLPWHARWDTGRTLLNRAFGSDYPGTYAIRRDVFLRMGGYDGDAMFENLELARTVRAVGGREVCVDDLFVARRPPSLPHFVGQRVRQAYDDLSQPLRLGVEASLLPGALALCWQARRRAGSAGAIGALSAGAIGVAAVAEVGRRRAHGAAVFPPGAAAWAPLWLAERAVCVWLALGCRLRGGVRYGDQRVLLAAHRLSWLRRRLHNRVALLPLRED
jgi:hypothetical protein